MREANGGSSRLGRGRRPRAISIISTERRLLAWAVMLVGAALMAAGGVVVFASMS
jgi:hypothetical protein